MIEKIRISLWDVFAFFLSGLLLLLFLVGHLFVFEFLTVQEFKDIVLNLPASISLFLIPAFCMVTGLLLEPLANYFDKYLMKHLWEMLPFRKHHEKVAQEEKALEKIVREKYLGSLKNVPNAYHLCKEYVETKQLSTTFMIFLSRFGFYRNMTFLCVASAVAAGFHYDSWRAYAPVMGIWLVLAIVFKHRAEDFFSYLAPNVYRCYLADKALKE